MGMHFTWNLLDFDLQTDEEAVDISEDAIKQKEEDKVLLKIEDSSKNEKPKSSSQPEHHHHDAPEDAKGDNHEFVKVIITSIAILISCVVVFVWWGSSAQKPRVVQPLKLLIITAPEPELDDGSKKVTIFFGMQTGTAEGFAKALAEDAKARYDKVTFKVVDLDDYAADDEAYEEKLKNESLATFFMATYGDGELTDNAARFYKWFTEDKEKEAWLQNTQCRVFGLGNRQYEHFNKVAVVVDEILAVQGWSCCWI